MDGLKRAIPAVFAVIFVAMAIGTGYARGAPPVAGQVVLCLAHGTAIVLVDETGQPVRIPVECPDCSLVQTGHVPDGTAPFGNAWSKRLDRFSEPYAGTFASKSAFDRPFVRGPPSQHRFTA